MEGRKSGRKMKRREGKEKEVGEVEKKRKSELRKGGSRAMNVIQKCNSSALTLHPFALLEF